MKFLGLAVSDKKIFENCILKTYFLTPWPTYATNQNHLNNFDRVPPRDHSCEVWSKSSKRFQRRCSLKKVLTDERTHAPTDDGHLKDHKSSLSTSCSGELKINQYVHFIRVNLKTIAQLVLEKTKITPKMLSPVRKMRMTPMVLFVDYKIDEFWLIQILIYFYD